MSTGGPAGGAACTWLKLRKADGEEEEEAGQDHDDGADRNAIAFVEHAFEFEKYELVRWCR